MRDIMPTTGGTGVVFPPQDLSALLDLGRFLELHTEPALLLGPDGEQVPLPGEVYRVLVKVVEGLREGKVITVVPRTQRLTTQEAADFLGISRPTLVKLLERGEIPYEQPGRHRRVMFSDLLAYRQRRQEERRAALDRMTEDASEAGLYATKPAGLHGGPEESPQASCPQGGCVLRCHATHACSCPWFWPTRCCALPRKACTVRCGHSAS
jgi:excisionase family DNA binding protein